VKVFAGLSARSPELRFLAALPRLDERMLEWISNVDQDHHIAWVAYVDERAVSLASYLNPTGLSPTSSPATPRRSPFSA
jgi:hypothetical protein